MRASAGEWRRLVLAAVVSGSASAWPFLEVSIISPSLPNALGVFLIRYFPGFAFGIAAMRLPLWSGARAWRRVGFVAICVGCFHLAWWITVSFVDPLARDTERQLSVTALVGGVVSTLLMMVALSVLVRGYRPLAIIGVACASGILDSALMALWTLDGVLAARDVNTFASRTGYLLFFVGAQVGMLVFMRLALRKAVVDTGGGPRRWPTIVRLLTGAAGAAVVAVGTEGLRVTFTWPAAGSGGQAKRGAP